MKPKKPKRAPNKTSFVVGGPNPGFKSGAANPRFKQVEVPPATGTEITNQQLDVLTRLAAVGVRAADMRYVVNMSQDVWASYCQQHPEVEDAIAKGEGKMHDRIAAVLNRKALKGDFMSAALLMNGRFGYRPNEGGVGNQSVKVNIVNLPGALPAGTVVEGQRLHDDDPTPMSIESHDFSPTDLTLQAPHLTERATSDEYRPPPAEPAAASSGRTRAMRDFESIFGISTRRSSFTAAGWKRFNKDR